MIDYEKVNGSDEDKNLKIHTKRILRSMKSIFPSKDCREQRYRYMGMSQFFSACRSWCHRSVANAELWSTPFFCFAVAFIGAGFLECVPENVRTAANSLPKSTSHTTIVSVPSVHDSCPRLLPRLSIGSNHYEKALGEGTKEARV